MTPLRLPEPRDEPLRRSPLSLVVCQVRHDPVLAMSDSRRALDIKAQLGERYPKIEARRMMLSVVAGPGGAKVDQGQPTGWQMRSSDEAWTVTLQTDFFSLETSAYDGWHDFRQRLEELVKAVLSINQPVLEERLGLRMVDEVVDPPVTAPGGWRGWIRPELLGPLAGSDFGESVRTLQQVVELDAGGGYRVLFRHGTTPIPGDRDKRWVYLLDHDCFRQAGCELTQDGVLAAAEDLHRIALQVFQGAITPELYQHLKGDDGQ